VDFGAAKRCENRATEEPRLQVSLKENSMEDNVLYKLAGMTTEYQPRKICHQKLALPVGGSNYARQQSDSPWFPHQS
jgi:hypothetical protein